MTQTTEHIGKVLSIKVSGKVTTDEMKRYVDDLEKIIDEHGQARLLINMESFPLAEPGAIWKDLKFSAKHFNHIERVAVVGDQAWQEWYIKFTNPLSPAEIRHFGLSQMQAAWDWLREDE